MTAEPTATAVWEQGAKGEEAVGVALDRLPDVITLHDRRMLGQDGRPTRANIDHLVVAASGIWVVDAKTHVGRLEVRRSGGILSSRVEQLFINGRDHTHLIEVVQRQVETVARVLTDMGIEAPVQGTLCFVGTTLPWVTETIAGVPLVGRRTLTKLLQREGALDPQHRRTVAGVLAGRFVPA